MSNRLIPCFRLRGHVCWAHFVRFEFNQGQEEIGISRVKSQLTEVKVTVRKDGRVEE